MRHVLRTGVFQERPRVLARSRHALAGRFGSVPRRLRFSRSLRRRPSSGALAARARVPPRCVPGSERRCRSDRPQQARSTDGRVPTTGPSLPAAPCNSQALHEHHGDACSCAPTRSSRPALPAADLDAIWPHHWSRHERGLPSPPQPTMRRMSNPRRPPRELEAITACPIGDSDDWRR